MQILLAGKAHPHDTEGKELIRQIIHFARDPQVRRSVVFLEDYDISVARYLVQGVDVWLNTPRRPNEASGTSGMKLLANGGLNLSILDGWWDEAYDREVGWAIGNGEEYDNADYQDQVESEALYHILENDVVPLFYDRDAAGIPRGWLAKMKASMKRLSPIFSTNRMVAEYAERFYLPAANRVIRLTADKSRVLSLMDWRKRLHVHGSEVKVTQVDVDGGSREFLVGSKVKVSARVSLGSVCSRRRARAGLLRRAERGRPDRQGLARGSGAAPIEREPITSTKARSSAGRAEAAALPSASCRSTKMRSCLMKCRGFGGRSSAPASRTPPSCCHSRECGAPDAKMTARDNTALSISRPFLTRSST